MGLPGPGRPGQQDHTRTHRAILRHRERRGNTRRPTGDVTRDRNPSRAPACPHEWSPPMPNRLTRPGMLAYAFIALTLAAQAVQLIRLHGVWGTDQTWVAATLVV